MFTQQAQTLAPFSLVLAQLRSPRTLASSSADSGSLVYELYAGGRISENGGVAVELLLLEGQEKAEFRVARLVSALT